MHTAVELGTKSITAVTAKVNGAGPEIVQSSSAEIGPGGLEKAFEQVGAAGQKVVFVVPRGQALLRDFELPQGTPDELVAMVRFQVEREMPIPMDQLHYSYIETGRAEGKVKVQVAAVPRDVLGPALAAAQAAGVKVAGAYVSTYGLLALNPDGAPTALVEVSGGEAEILIVDEGRMEFSRTAPLSEDAEAGAIAEEIDRTLMAWSARAAGKEIKKVVLAGAGEAAEKLATELGLHLQRQVQPVGPGDLETAPAAGVCIGLARSRSMPDVLHPPVAVKRVRLTPTHRVLALAAVILVMLVVWAQVSLADKRSELAAKKEQLKNLEPKVKALRELRAQTALAQQWSRDRNAWIPTLRLLGVNVRTNDLWIESATFESRGVIRFQGKTRDPKHVHALVEALTKDDFFKEVNTERIVQNTEKGSYAKDFTIKAELAGGETR